MGKNVDNNNRRRIKKKSNYNEYEWRFEHCYRVWYCSFDIIYFSLSFFLLANQININILFILVKKAAEGGFNKNNLENKSIFIASKKRIIRFKSSIFNAPKSNTKIILHFCVYECVLKIHKKKIIFLLDEKTEQLRTGKRERERSECPELNHILCFVWVVL